MGLDHRLEHGPHIVGHEALSAALFGKMDAFIAVRYHEILADLGHETVEVAVEDDSLPNAMQEAVKKDDDRSLALSALIEGEATLAMFGAGMDDYVSKPLDFMEIERVLSRWREETPASSAGVPELVEV